MPSDPATSSAQRWAWVLWLLSGLFLARVLGQIVVILLEPAWLPPMGEWYSGLLPYPLLLPVQMVILAVMLWINVGVMRGSGYFTRPHPRFGRFLFWFAIVYTTGMLVRYFVSDQAYPELLAAGKLADLLSLRAGKLSVCAQQAGEALTSWRTAAATARILSSRSLVAATLISRG